MPIDETGAAPVMDDFLYLIGRPPLAGFLAYVKAQISGATELDVGGLASEWGIANHVVADLERKEAGAANSPAVQELPASMKEGHQRLLRDPMFKKSFSIVPTSVGMVDLDRLVVFQKHINLNHVARLREKIKPGLDGEDLFRFCIPYDHPLPPLHGGQIAENVFGFTSPSNDLRLQDARLLGPSQVTGFIPPGPIAGIIAISIGFGPNFLQAWHIENRLILGNGSHRAFALREAGLDRVPCIVQHPPSREELLVIGAQEVMAQPDLYLKGARPPLLKDYFNPKLVRTMKAPRKIRQVRVAYQLEMLDIHG